MAWTSLSSRLASLPLVLAGPVIRKTTSTSVSVWIALKEEVTSLELVISSGTSIIGRATTSTRRFGRNLHIALITVNGLTLTVATKYFYDINFGSSRSLVTQRILSSSGGVAKIVYGSDSLPSFMLPSNNMSELKIIHASCRKPHGGVIGSDDTDAFKAIDTILTSTVNQLNNRPQQLYLTGDQIYSDDVSDMLLFMLRDAENSLLGWPVREQLPSAPDPTNLNPLHRIPLITRAGFTCGDVGKSHLLRLGEFYSMYLFVWSEELWPTQRSNFPGFDSEYIYASDDDDFELSGEHTSAKYEGKINVLLNFFQTLSMVRKVLANIPTYMMFDDHEITDDWNLTRPWVDAVFSSTDGKRIIQNGLSAYAVFQGWGNKPEIFGNTASNEKRLLDTLVVLNQHGEANTSQSAEWTAIESLVIPTISGTDLTGGIDWSYSLSFDKFNVIALNARTNRALFRSYAGLLSTSAMQSQIRNRVSEKLPGHEFTIIIAPAPVFGLPLMEEFVQPIVSYFSGSTAADFEPWSADRNKFEQFLKEISAFGRVLLLSGDVHYAFSNSIDYWDQRSGTEVRSKFVNLTASSLKNSKSGPPDGTIFLADAVNNHIPEILLLLENDGLFVGWNSPGTNYITTEERTLLGGIIPVFTTTGTLSVNRGSGTGVSHWHKLIPYSRRDTPNIGSATRTGHERRQWVNPGFPPHWEYKIIFESDFRGDTARMAGTMPTISSSTGPVGSGSRHRTLASTRGNHTIVGNTNIGEITFQWGAGENDKKVVHKIWSKVGSNFIPHTIHLIDFGIASSADQKPSEIERVP